MGISHQPASSLAREPKLSSFGVRATGAPTPWKPLSSKSLHAEGIRDLEPPACEASKITEKSELRPSQQREAHYLDRSTSQSPLGILPSTPTNTKYPTRKPLFQKDSSMLLYPKPPTNPRKLDNPLLPKLCTAALLLFLRRSEAACFELQVSAFSPRFRRSHSDGGLRRLPFKALV